MTLTYITALRTSLMSLYEASDIIPGQSFRARDLVRGGDPVVVSERTATRTLKTWDRIAARIVEHNGKIDFSRRAAVLHLGSLRGAILAIARSPLERRRAERMARIG